MIGDPANQLAVLIHGERAGIAVQGEGGRLSFSYDHAWQRNRSTPLSLSMPLATETHPDHVVRAFLWGLLPDNEHVLERWARDYRVSAGNPFALLRHVGEDCAGAAQFVTLDRVEALLTGDGGVSWIDDSEIAGRLRNLRRDPAAWHTATTGQFSLAGAQAKTALHYDAESTRWGDPWGSVPTTHILKPAVAGFDDHDLNEHLCLQAANLLGLAAVTTEIRTFETERAILVERYDREYLPDGGVRRIHQEDLCQALGTPPTRKYQNEGGPTPEQIIGLLRREVSPPHTAAASVDRFVDAIAYSWITGGSDGHAKNYAVLIEQGLVRLAPLYDLASALPYDNLPARLVRLAMKIGGEYRLGAVSGRHWRRFANANGLDPDEIVARVDRIAAATPDAIAQVINTDSVRALGSELPGRLLEAIAAQAQRCRRALRKD